MLRSLAAGLSLLALALAPAPQAHAARGMELALQDDAVFVEQRWMDRDAALDHAVDLRTKRIRVNVLWARTLVAGAYDRTIRPAGRSTTSPASTRCRRPRRARHQAAADDHRPRARLGHARPPGRQQRPRRRQVRRVRPHRRRALRGPRRSLLDLERAELEHLAAPGNAVRRASTAGSTSPATATTKARRSDGQGADRRTRPDRRRPRDRPVEVPARRHLLERRLQGQEAVRAAEGRRLRHPPLPVPGRAAARRRQARRRADRRALASDVRARQARPAQGAKRPRTSAGSSST